MLNKFTWLVLLLILFPLTGCVNRPLEYKGADAGYLVASIGEENGTDYMEYALQVRRKGASTPYEQTSIAYPFAFTRSYKDNEGKGAVNIKRFSPGEYEVFALYVTENNSAPQVKLMPNQEFSVPLKVSNFELMTKMLTSYSAMEFSIPITIKPGKATYIGNYQAVTFATYRNALGLQRSTGGAYFILQDKRERDVALAKELDSSITDIEFMLPTINSIGTPYIRSNKPSK